jgi:hypothetical protein
MPDTKDDLYIAVSHRGVRAGTRAVRDPGQAPGRRRAVDERCGPVSQQMRNGASVASPDRDRPTL